jgi:amino acid transporter
MASASVSARAAQRPPWETIVAVAAVVSLALWPVEIHKAFGLPAHPLLIHVPVVFVPILGLAVLAVAFNARWFDRFGLLVAAFSVVTLAATLLAVGAGEAFRKERLREFPDLANDPTLHDHADAGITVRLAMVILTALLVGMLFAKRAPTTARIALRVLAVLFALTAIGFVIRTGHLGAKLAWGDQQQQQQQIR